MSHEYTIDVNARITLRVTADSLADALSDVREIQAAERGVMPRNVVLRELSTCDEDETVVVERDGEDLQGMDEPVECSECGEVYDEASGDGYCGLCPSCADKSED